MDPLVWALNRVRSGDPWTRVATATALVFGGLWVAASFGWSGAVPVAAMILLGVILFHGDYTFPRIAGRPA